MALATAIKVGGSLLGGLLGRKKTSNRVDYARLRRDAEAAGFNPLTALIHGGAAGYTQTSAPPLQTAGLIMDAANALSDHYKTPDPVAAERERLEQELLKARIDALQGSARSTGVMGSTQAASVSGRVYTPFGGAAPAVMSTIPVQPQAPVEMSSDGSVSRSVELYNDHVRRDGSSVRMPVGPDIDEAIMGAVIEGSGRFNDWSNDTPVGRGFRQVTKQLGQSFPSPAPFLAPLSLLDPQRKKTDAQLVQGAIPSITSINTLGGIPPLSTLPVVDPSFRDQFRHEWANRPKLPKRQKRNN